MSRTIDLTKPPLSDDDRQYLTERNRLHDIAIVDALAEGEEAPEPPMPPGLTELPPSTPLSPDAVAASVAGRMKATATAETEKVEDGDDDPEKPEGETEDGDPADNYDDEEAWSYRDLQDEAQTRSLPATGKRDELIARLRENDSAS